MGDNKLRAVLVYRLEGKGPTAVCLAKFDCPKSKYNCLSLRGPRFCFCWGCFSSAAGGGRLDLACWLFGDFDSVEVIDETSSALLAVSCKCSACLGLELPLVLWLSDEADCCAWSSPDSDGDTC